VTIESEDTLADFETRMHAAEHKLIVKAVQIMLGQLEDTV
jgi:folate-dependent phosphoribosylglycinamide formyltransferase PurN